MLSSQNKIYHTSRGTFSEFNPTSDNSTFSEFNPTSDKGASSGTGTDTGFGSINCDGGSREIMSKTNQ